MKKENVVILGSTGSIGKQAIDVIDYLSDKKIIGLACEKNIKELFLQIKKTGAKYACVYDKNKSDDLSKMCKHAKINCKIYSGMSGLLTLSSLKDADIIINSVVGMIGINPTIEAIKNKKIICLANKETLVCAGHIIMPLAKKYNVEIRPIDSEHSAIWQCLKGYVPGRDYDKNNHIKKLIITASGGPFYGKKKDELKNVTVDDCLKHPTWNMGRKVTIDSSTLVNKGLEIIEAMYLFNIPIDNIEVIIQKDSIIHSMVEFDDGAVMAELGVPSMRLPIAYAITGGDRRFINERSIDFDNIKNITIDRPDEETFPALSLAYKVARMGGIYPALYNRLDEIAVQKFVDHKISYLNIVEYINNGIIKYENYLS